MGQYGNQPDFATRALNITPTGDVEASIPGQNLNSAALYIATGGTLLATVAGNNRNEVTVFTNIPDGTFFPVIVNNVWATFDTDSSATTCGGIVALY